MCVSVCMSILNFPFVPLFIGEIEILCSSFFFFLIVQKTQQAQDISCHLFVPSSLTFSCLLFKNTKRLQGLQSSFILPFLCITVLLKPHCILLFVILPIFCHPSFLLECNHQQQLRVMFQKKIRLRHSLLHNLPNSFIQQMFIDQLVSLIS